MDFTYIEKIIAVVRKLLGHFPDYSKTISHNADICLSEVEGKVSLINISIKWYDEILITPTKILFYPDRGETRIITEYDSFDDLINFFHNCNEKKN